MRIIWLGRPELPEDMRVTRFAGKILTTLRKVIPADESGEGLVATCRWDAETEEWDLEEVFEESSGRSVWRKGSGLSRK